MTINDLPERVKIYFRQLLKDRERMGKVSLKYITLDFNGEWWAWESRPRVLSTNNKYLGWSPGSNGAFDWICTDEEKHLTERWDTCIVEWKERKEILEEELFQI